MGKRRISVEKKTKKHNKVVEKIFQDPKILPLLSEGTIKVRLKFPHSKITKRELTDLIFLKEDAERNLHLYFIEIKTGIFLKGGKAQTQISTALKYFLRELPLWKEKELKILKEKKCFIHSLLIWFPPFQYAPQIISYKKLFLK